MGTTEISKQVASAVGEVRHAMQGKKTLTHKDVTELIQIASKKYGISEKHIRTVGVLPKKDDKQLIKVYNDYDDED